MSRPCTSFVGEGLPRRTFDPLPMHIVQLKCVDDQRRSSCTCSDVVPAYAPVVLCTCHSDEAARDVIGYDNVALSQKLLQL
jgi:hypothetical protein